MKKTFYLLAALAALASCSTDDGMEGTAASKVITFDTPFISVSSRATGDLNKDGITGQGILLWGDQYVKDALTSEPVYNQDLNKLSWNGNAWVSEKLAFWEKNLKYDFTAVAPAQLPDGVKVSYGAEEAESSFTLADRKVKISGVPLTQVISNKDEKGGYDILVGNAIAQDENTSTVQLTFKHILSRFSIYAYTDSKEADGTVTIKSMSIYLPKAGSATYQQAKHEAGAVSGQDAWTWTGFANVKYAEEEVELTDSYQRYELVESANPLTLKYANSPSAVYQAAKAAPQDYLLPTEFFMAPTATIEQNNVQLWLAIDYTISGKGQDDADNVQTKEYTKLVPIQDLHSFRQGYQTNLFICVNKPIEFRSMTVNDWKTEKGNLDIND